MTDYIPRTIEIDLDNAKSTKAHLIYGARQVGKTSLLKHLLKGKEFEWLSGESSTDRRRLKFDTDRDISDFLGAHKIIVIDEAQYIEDIGLSIKRMVDQKTDTLIFLTGSTSLRLAPGVKESAVGRLSFIELFPLSIQELTESKSKDWVNKNIERLLVTGMYPEIIDSFDDNIDRLGSLLLNYTNGVFLQDIYQLGNIRKSTTLMNLLRILAAGVGSQMSYDSLARECGISKQTVVNYLDLLEQNFVIFKVESYAKNLTNELRKSKKFYFFDNGVRNALLDNFDLFPHRTDKGALFENFVAAELYKMHSYRKDRTHLYFWRTAQGHEVDFLEVKNQRIIRAIECKASQNTRIRLSEVFEKAYGIERQVITPNMLGKFLSRMPD